MRKLRGFLAFCFSVVLASSASAVTASKSTPPQRAGAGAVVANHIPQLDGPATTVAGSDGRVWATWSYRASGEFDIAVSVSEGDATSWSAPFFFGRRNGSDELDPVIAIDAHGVVYLAYSTTAPSRVALVILSPGSPTWTEPVVVSGADTASSPALLLVGDRLVVAFRTARGLRMVAPIFGSANQLDGIQDGSDPMAPLGAKENGVNPPPYNNAPASNWVPAP